MNDIEPNYNYQIITGERSTGKIFFENRIRQAYKSGIDDGFKQKQNLIKYLEDKKEQSHKQEIICRKRRVPKLYEIGICLGEQYAYQNILERIKSGKYE